MEDWSVPAVGCGGAELIWGGFGGEQCSVLLTAPHCHLQPPVVLRGLCPARPAPEASMGTPSTPCGAPPRLGNTGADHPQHQSCIPPSGRHRYARWAVRRTHWCWLSGHSKCVAHMPASWQEGSSALLGPPCRSHTSSRAWGAGSPSLPSDSLFKPTSPSERAGNRHKTLQGAIFRAHLFFLISTLDSIFSHPQIRKS